MADKRGVFKLNDYIDKTLEGETDTVDDVWIFPDNDGPEFKYVDGTITPAPAATPPAPTTENKRYMLMDLYTPTMSTDTSYPYKGQWGDHGIAIGSTVIYSSNVKYKDEEQYDMAYTINNEWVTVAETQPIGAVAIHDASKITANLSATFGRSILGFNTVSTGVDAVGAGFSEGWVYNFLNNSGQGVVDIPAFRGSLNSEVNFIKQPELPYTTRLTGQEGSIDDGEGHHFGSFIALSESEGKMAIGADNFAGYHDMGRVYVMNTDGTGIKSCIVPGSQTRDAGAGNRIAIGGGKVFVGARLTDIHYSNGNIQYYNTGKVYVYDYNGTLLHTLSSPLTNQYGSPMALYFGRNVFLSSDNSTLYVTDIGNTTDPNSGSARGGRVFRFNASNYTYLGVFDDDSLGLSNSSNYYFGEYITEVNNGKLLIARYSTSGTDKLFICDPNGSNMVEVEVPYYYQPDDATYSMVFSGRSIFYNNNDQKIYFIAHKYPTFYTEGSFLIRGHVGVGNTFVVDSQFLQRDPPTSSSFAHRRALQEKFVGITSNRVFISSGGRNYADPFDYEVYTYPDPSDGFDIQVYPAI